ncbi:RlmE family RNA methyltransferase [Candidatus Binatia bacterium]|nr:RlmE family RNA methyltransferase [Candidatus Binatia bacterium]
MRALLTSAVAGYERKDAVYRRAKREGFRSRAAIKLEELDRLFSLLRPGQRVVDLGCWPGGWLQVCADRVGARGRVVGVDVAETQQIERPNVVVLNADVYADGLVQRVRDALGGPADLLLSDLAPKMSGIAASDSARHAALVHRALDLARALLAPDGIFLAKLFMDAEYQGLIQEIRGTFAAVKARKLDTTRKGSSELYVCGRGLKGAVPPT